MDGVGDAAGVEGRGAEELEGGIGAGEIGDTTTGVLGAGAGAWGVEICGAAELTGALLLDGAGTAGGANGVLLP